MEKSTALLLLYCEFFSSLSNDPSLPLHFSCHMSLFPSIPSTPTTWVFERGSGSGPSWLATPVCGINEMLEFDPTSEFCNEVFCILKHSPSPIKRPWGRGWGWGGSCLELEQRHLIWLLLSKERLFLFQSSCGPSVNAGGWKTGLTERLCNRKEAQSCLPYLSLFPVSRASSFLITVVSPPMSPFPGDPCLTWRVEKEEAGTGL